MTTEQRLIALAQAIGTDIKGLIATRGNLDNLFGSSKSNLVEALNELFYLIGDAQEIHDASLPTSLSTTYSANKINALVAQAKNDILGGASSAYDTLLELQNMLIGDDTAISGLLTAVGNKIDYTVSQSLTTPQKLQACSNLGIGDPDHNFITDYTTARDAV